MPTRIILAVFSLFISSASLPAHGAQLPQDEEYKKVLRRHLGTFTAGDFELGEHRSTPIGFELDWVDTEEKAFPIWLDVIEMKALPNETPTFTASPESFTLSSIEAEDGIRLDPSYRDGVTALIPLWWSNWNYPGNPWRNNRALLNRAYVMGAIDLIMFDTMIRTRDGRFSNRSDFIGGRLVWMAAVYLHTKEHLPPEVADAYLEGLKRLLAQMEKLGPDGRTDNMNTKGLVGLHYLGEAAPELKPRVEAYAERIISIDQPSRVHPAGVIFDAGGVETSYNGIALNFITHAALMANWPALHKSLEQMMLFKGLMTLPDPDGCYAAPNHFNSRVGGDAPHDQWALLSREIGVAMVSKNGRFLLGGGRYGNSLGTSLPELETMQTKIASVIERWNKTPSAEPYQFGVWRQSGAGSWSFRLPYAGAHYRPGFYREIKQLAQSHDPSLKLPLLLRDSFETFLPDPALKPPANVENSFFMVRRPSYYLISFTGDLGWHSYINWGGGGISAFWTPEAGSILLGRSAGLERNNWNDWKIWPVNTISGEDATGNAFSASRLRRSQMEVSYDRESPVPRVTVSGTLNSTIGKGRLVSQGESLQGDNRFTRVIETHPEAVQVRLSLQSDGRDQINELFESLPVYLRNAQDPPQRELRDAAKIELLVAQNWAPATHDYTDKVERIRISRFQGGAEIVFEKPQRVRLAPDLWSSDPKRLRGSEVQSVHIDLLNGQSTPCPFPSGTLNYSLRSISLP